MKATCVNFGVVLLLVLGGPAVAASADGGAPPGRAQLKGAQVGYAVRSGVSPAVRDMKPVPPPAMDPNQVREIPRLRPPKAQKGKSPTPPFDPAAQRQLPQPMMPNPIMTFEGISNDDNFAAYGFRVLPPDTNGAVGPNHYVQTVNLLFRVFNKATGVPLTAPLKISSLFGAVGAPCATTDHGDPVVMYDHLADRWFLTQFAVVGPPSHQCVAVSQTADPAGSYFVYDFVMPNNKFNDYPKFGVWPDAYYMTDNQFNFAGTVALGAGVFALNRAKMLAGDPTANFIYFDLALMDPNIFGMLPASLDGPPPPAGRPGYFAYFTAGEFGDPQGDALRVFEFHADFATPANSTFTERPESPIPVAAFNPLFTAGRDDISQPPPAGSTSKLDAISDQLMYRLQYRNFGTHESLVTNHTVDTDGADHAGIRYYEVRRNLPGGAFFIQEQATFVPDAAHRWMGSAAMDSQGNLAVGYSVSSTTLFPSIRYAGRLTTDPPGGLFQGEATLQAGGGSQTSTSSRWGDYSALSVDPADGCTFWYTTEYYAASSEAGWRTRVGSFKFPSCGGGNLPPVAEANGPYNGSAGSPISFSSAGSMDPDGTIASFSWNFGDGSPPSNQANPTHTYTSAGNFTATLTVTDNQGAMGMDMAPVTVTGPGNLPPVAEANGPYNGTPGSSICFSSAGSFDPDGSIASFRWTFGDGTRPSAAANPCHTYASAGNFTATLTVTDNLGATGTDTAAVTVGGGNQPPVGEANGPYSGSVGNAISFSSAGSIDPDGTIVSFSWNFGDGSPPSNQANPTHTYASAGNFTATLTVTDNLGAVGMDMAPVTVTGGGNLPPVAEANGPYNGTPGSSICFSSAGSFDPDGSIASFRWTFGDGTRPSAAANPCHTYASAGNFTATLTVTDNLGATGTDTAAVTVTP